jgi:Acetyltransferase (GNAT) family
MSVEIAKEPFSMELFNELMPLAQKSWNESTQLKGKTCAFYGERDFNIEPDAEQYQQVHDAGGLILLVLRDERKLVGYLVAVTYRSWHHKTVLCANVDCIYVEPAYRSYTAVMIERFEKEALERSVQIIAWPTHVDGPVYEVLKFRGYVGDDLVMERRLCAS